PQTGQDLITTLDQPLAAGHYRIILTGNATLNLLDATDTVAMSDPGADLVLADFTVARAGPTLASATALATPNPSSTPIAGELASAPVAGALDFAADPYAVHLYKITLPQGHFWRLGLEVSAQRDGSSRPSLQKWPCGR